jgi:hypothetical protein
MSSIARPPNAIARTGFYNTLEKNVREKGKKVDSENLSGWQPELVVGLACHHFCDSMPDYHSGLLGILLRQARCDAHLQRRLYRPAAVLQA